MKQILIAIFLLGTLSSIGQTVNTKNVHPADKAVIHPAKAHQAKPAPITHWCEKINQS